MTLGRLAMKSRVAILFSALLVGCGGQVEGTTNAFDIASASRASSDGKVIYFCARGPAAVTIPVSGLIASASTKPPYGSSLLCEAWLADFTFSNAMNYGLEQITSDPDALSLSQQDCEKAMYSAEIFGYDAEGNYQVLSSSSSVGQWNGSCSITGGYYSFNNSSNAKFPYSRVRLAARYTINGVEQPLSAILFQTP
jgi:hypothetical protein